MILYLLLAYLIGAIPTGYIVARQLKGIDIREHGSGNVGATNVRRVVGPKAGLFVLIFDFFKGVIPVAVAMRMYPPELDPYALFPVGVGLMTLLGHSKSVFIGFTGGKSAITSLGVIFGLSPLAGLLVAAVAFTTIKVTRYVSVGSMLGAVLCPFAIWLFGNPISHALLMSLASVYVIYLHRSNIQRLLAHQENRI